MAITKAPATTAAKKDTTAPVKKVPGKNVPVLKKTEPKKEEPKKEEPKKEEAPKEVEKKPVPKPKKAVDMSKMVTTAPKKTATKKEETPKEEPKKEEPKAPATPKKNVPKVVLAPKKAEPKEEPKKEEAPKETAPKKPVPKPKKAADMSKMVTSAPKKADASKSSDKTVYHVSKRGLTKEDRVWKVFIQESSKVIKLFDTQAEALDYAKGLAKNKGNGSYVVLHGLDGKIRKF